MRRLVAAELKNKTVMVVRRDDNDLHQCIEFDDYNDIRDWMRDEKQGRVYCGSYDDWNGTRKWIEFIFSDHADAMLFYMKFK